MANVVVVGAQWGDEGKGKIVDWLSERADVVVRFQGGHNAGHTLVIGRQDLQAVAAAVGRRAAGQARRHRQRRRRRSVGARCRDRQARRRRASPITRDNLRIAENATLILPLHRELDVDPRGSRRRRPRSARPGAASARPTRTRSAAAPSAFRIWPTPATLGAKIERLLVASQCAAPRPRPAARSIQATSSTPS